MDRRNSISDWKAGWMERKDCMKVPDAEVGYVGCRPRGAGEQKIVREPFR